MEVLWMPGGVRIEVHLDGAATGGAFCLLVDEPPVGWSLPVHRHTREAETMHVVAGDFEVEVDGRCVRVGPGGTVHVPQGVPHTGANVGDVPGRRVLLFSPAGMEAFFREVGAPAADEVSDLAGILAAAGRHGWRFG